MKRQLHHIKKQLLVLDFPTEEKSIKWSKTASTFYFSKVIPLLDRVLDRHFTNQQVYVINRLEINLKNVDEDNFQETFLRKTEEELTRILRSKSFQVSSKIAQTPSKEISKSPSQSNEKIFIQGNEENLLECFYFFLEHGILPWSNNFTNLTLLETNLKQTIGIKKIIYFRKFQNLLGHINCRRRLYFQFSSVLWEELCELIYTKELSLLESIRAELINVFIFLAHNKLTKKKLTKALSGDIKDWIGYEASADIQEWPKEYIQWMIGKASPFLSPKEEASLLPIILRELIEKKKNQLNLNELNPIINAVISLKMSTQEISSQQNQKENIYSPNTYSPEEDQISSGIEIDTKNPSSKSKEIEKEPTEKTHQSEKGSSPDKIPASELTVEDIQQVKELKTPSNPNENKPSTYIDENKKKKHPENQNKTKHHPINETKNPLKPNENKPFSNPDENKKKTLPEKRDKTEYHPLDKTKSQESNTLQDESVGSVSPIRPIPENVNKIKNPPKPDEIKSFSYPDEDKKKIQPEKWGNKEEHSFGEIKREDSDALQEKSTEKVSPMRPDERKEAKTKDGSPLDSEILIKNIVDQHPDNSSGLASFYINHSGLILTWPYLTRLFNYTGFLEGNHFKDKHLQQRAVHLLSFLLSGQEHCEEPYLIMPKFLCGWPLEMPIIKVLNLTLEEKNEGEQMLRNLIVNWPVLKNTSIDGLRSSFFSRDGKLFREEENWRLLVEQKSYDMLLDHLPYSLHIIKLPWMKDILKVDWA